MADRSKFKQSDLLTDFGLSSVLVNNTIAYTNGGLSTVSGCSFRWIAPELSAQGNSRRTEASDIWAFGLVCQKIPYYECKEDFQVVRAIISGHLPVPPQRSPSTEPGSDTRHRKTCDLMHSCWEQKPEDRPTCQWIIQTLEREGLVRRCQGETRESQDFHFPTVHACSNTQLDANQVENILNSVRTLSH